jgi:hypothetical protein
MAKEESWKPSVKYNAGEAIQRKFTPAFSKQVMLTTKLAEELLDMAVFEGERGVNERHLQYLLNQHAAGRFDWNFVTIITAELGGRMYRLNGQHTSWLRIFMPGKFGDPEIRRLHYRVTDDDQLRELYAAIDRNKTRTPAHILKALIIGTETGAGIQHDVIALIGAGIRLWKEEIRTKAKLVDPQDVAKLIEENLDAVQATCEWYQAQGHGDRLHLRRAGAFAAMLATFTKAPRVAVDFWTAVCNGIGFQTATDPRRVLREMLITSTVQSAGRGKKSIGQEDMYRCCISSWNKWRKGEEAQATIRPGETRKQPV